MSDGVVVVVENELSKEGLCSIIAQEEFEVIGKASCPEELDWSDFPEETIALIDFGKRMDKGAAIEKVLEQIPSCRCIVLSDEFDFNDAITCFKSGAAGVLLKTMHCPPLLAALRLAALGERVVPSALIDSLSPSSPVTFEAADRKALKVNLSDREKDVLRCLMAGFSNKVIARTLDLSEATIKVHVKAILRKLKVANRTQAALWGSSHQIVDPMPGEPVYS